MIINLKQQAFTKCNAEIETAGLLCCFLWFQTSGKELQPETIANSLCYNYISKTQTSSSVYIISNCYPDQTKADA